MKLFRSKKNEKNIDIEFDGKKYEISADSFVNFNNAQIKYANGNILGAINDITNAINIASNQNLYFFRANYYEDINEYDKAINDYFKYIEIYQDDYFVLFRIALCYQHKKMWDKAVNYYSDALNKEEFTEDDFSIVRRSQAHNNIAICFANLGNSEKCIAHCSEAIALNNEYANAYFVRGLEYNKLNDDKWLPDVEKAAKLGYEKAKQFLDNNKGNKNSELDNFLKEVALKTEIRNKQLASIKKPLRDYFENDWRIKLSKLKRDNSLNYINVLNQAIIYTIDMWQEWIKNSGFINDFDKASVAYELSQTIIKFIPQLDSNELYEAIFIESLEFFDD